MILYFADRAFNILGLASTGLSAGLVVTDDKKTEDVDTGVATFEATIPYDASNRQQVEQYTQVGNYLLRSNEDENEFYTIIETEVDTRKQSVYLYAEGAGLDLLNEICGPYAADQAYPIAHYINKFAYDSGFEIGVNEVDALSRKLSWDGEATATERIASVATQFDGCEVSYSFEVKGLQVVHKYINIWAERGKDVGAQLRLNYDVDRIVTSKSIANVATALLATGGTPEDSDTPIDLAGYTYDDGDIYLEGRYLKTRSALAKWSRYLNPNEQNQTYTGHILRTYSYDTTSQSELCNRAVARLRKISDAEINYDVDIAKLPDGIRLGDRVNIVDDAGNLYVSARILQLETSVTGKTQKATVGEYIIRSSGISQRVEELAEQFVRTAKEQKSATLDAAKTATDYIERTDSGGVQVGDKSGGTWSGYRAVVNSDSFDVVDGSGNVASRFGANSIELGKGNADAVIKLCDGKTEIRHDEESSAAHLGYTMIGTEAMQAPTSSGGALQYWYGGANLRIADQANFVRLYVEKETVQQDGTSIPELDDNYARESSSVDVYSDSIAFVTASSYFNGSVDIAVDLEIGGTATTSGLSVKGGGIELNSGGTLDGYGGFIDFHYNKSSADYTSRIIEDASGQLNLIAQNGVKVNGEVVESGTWTPACPNIATPTQAVGSYLRIGKQVILSFCIYGAASSSDAGSFSLRITGLPVAPDTSVKWQAGGGNVTGVSVPANYAFSGFCVEKTSSYGAVILPRCVQVSTAAGTRSSSYCENPGSGNIYMSGTIMYRAA